MPAIIIGVDESGRVAAEAKDVVALVKIDSEGNAKTVSFKPKTKNPGQEIMQASGEAEAIVIGLMQGPLNPKKEIINIEPGTSIEEIVEKHKQGKLYVPTNEYTNTEYNVPKQDGSGQGTRANIGRNPECEPEDYKAIGKGSGTLTGRVTESSPQGKAQSTAQNNVNNQYTSQSTIDMIVDTYSNAKTDEQKKIVAQAVKQYLKEAADKNLKGTDAEKYVENKLKENGYSKSNNYENSSTSKESAKK